MLEFLLQIDIFGSYLSYSYCIGHIQKIFFRLRMVLTINTRTLQLLRDVAEKLVDGEGVTDDKLDEDPANWALWKESILLPDDYPGNYDLAMFMFCMLNQ